MRSRGALRGALERSHRVDDCEALRGAAGSAFIGDRPSIYIGAPYYFGALLYNYMGAHVNILARHVNNWARAYIYRRDKRDKRDKRPDERNKRDKRDKRARLYIDARVYIDGRSPIKALPVAPRRR